MADIREQKLIYHITSLDNLPSILDSGLLPRAELSDFDDVADPEILSGRQAYGLEQYVPFHFFARNPFDEGVQKANRGTDFVLISVRRTLARAQNWSIIPRHPLALEGIDVFDFGEGFDSIDWDAMNRREYDDHDSKTVCMAECLSPQAVPVGSFFKLFVPSEAIEQAVESMLRERGLDLEIVVNRQMFSK